MRTHRALRRGGEQPHTAFLVKRQLDTPTSYQGDVAAMLDVADTGSRGAGRHQAEIEAEDAYHGAYSKVAARWRVRFERLHEHRASISLMVQAVRT